MPLSAPRHPLSCLGAARGERSRHPARADAPVHCLFRGGQSANLLPRVQCRHVRELPEGIAATSLTQPEDGGRSRPCTLPPRQTPQAAAGGSSGASRIVVPATLCEEDRGQYPGSGTNGQNQTAALSTPSAAVFFSTDFLLTANRSNDSTNPSASD